MFLSTGSMFNLADPAEVIDFLRHREMRRNVVPADRLHITTDGTGFFLQVMNGGVKEYPVRRAFVEKLFKWFSMPPSQLEKLGMETLASVMNDFLVSIRSGDVTVKIEDGEALSITSRKFSEIKDLDVLSIIEPLHVVRISRNDFFTRMYTKIRSTAEPQKGDVCGLGYNVLNSETGFQPLAINHFVLRYVCSNGAILRTSSREQSRVHYGYGEGELEEFLDCEVGRRQRETAGIVASLTGSPRRDATDRMDEVSKRLRAVAGRKRAEQLLSDVGESPSMFQIANLVSAFGRTLDIGRRLQMEQLAGELMLNDTGQGGSS